MDVQAGSSPNLQNVRFRPRTVHSRPGLSSISALTNGPYKSLGQFIDDSANNTVFALDANGVLWRTTNGATAVNMGAIFEPGTLLHSQLAFDRIFFSGFMDNQLTPGGPIRFWDGKTGTATPSQPGSTMTGSAGLNGHLKVGTYQFAVVFEYSDGTFSQAQGTPLSVVISTANSRVDLSVIPLGESGVVARHILTTLVNGSTFFYFAPYTIPDNNATTFTVGALDTAVEAIGEPATALLTASWTPLLPHIAPSGPANASTAQPSGTGDLSLGISDYTANGVSITALSRTNGIVTLVAASSLLFVYNDANPPSPGGATGGAYIGGVVSVAGVTTYTDFNGTALGPILTISSDGKTITYQQAGPDETAAAGDLTSATVAVAGQISAGLHQVAVLYETRWGFLTIPGLETIWTAAGGAQALIGNLPIGPWYVTARRVIFTAANLQDYFYLAQFRVPNNTQRTAAFDFTDAQLEGGDASSNPSVGTDLFNQQPNMSDAGGVGVYGNRMSVYGRVNAVDLQNAGFDGGWTLDGPLGWAEVANPGASTSASVSGAGLPEHFDAFVGEALSLSVNNNPDVQGVQQNVSALVVNNVTYSLDVWLKVKSVSGVGTNLAAYLYSPSTGQVSGASFAISATSAWQRATLVFTSGFAAIPADLLLQVALEASGVGTSTILIDQMSLYPTNDRREPYIMRFSDALDPETFDAEGSITESGVGDGERIMGAVQLRSFYYALKDRSIHVLYDDGVNDPAQWFTRKIDNVSGLASPNAVVSTESYFAYGSPQGFFIYPGGRPMKMNMEIEPTWETINWDVKYTCHMKYDTYRKVFYFFAPTGSDTAPKNSFICDVSEGIGQEDDPQGRKWGYDVWPQAINDSLIYILPSQARNVVLAGNKAYTHQTVKSSDDPRDDDGTAIDALYDTAYVKAGDRGQDLCGGTAITAEAFAGQCSLYVRARGLDGVVVQNLQTQQIGAAPGREQAIYANLESERVQMEFEVSDLDASFILRSCVIYMRPWAEARAL